MILLVDEGNTRLKAWWLSATGEVLAQGTFMSMQDVLARTDVMPGHLSRLCLASVRGGDSHSAWRDAAIARQLTIDIAYVDTARLPTCYVQPERLGIDRWLAVLAVSHLQRPALIVDAGTAVTLDVYQPGRGHVGGYILPGLRLQREVLAAQTARVNFPEPDWSDLALGTDTASCVGKGSLHALVALVRDVRAQLPDAPEVWVTGGDAQLLLPWLAEARHVPDLLLQGMAAYFGVALRVKA